MGIAHNGEDDIAFYAADVSHTFGLSVDSSGVVWTPDVNGAIPPGRYLVQAVDFTSGRCWVHFAPFEKGVTPTPTAPTAPGPFRIPLSRDGLIAFEVNVVKGYNDRIGATMTTGTCTLYMTLVSRPA